MTAVRPPSGHSVCNTVANIDQVDSSGRDFVRLWAGPAWFFLTFTDEAWTQLEHIVRERSDDHRTCGAAPDNVTVGDCCLPIGHAGGHAFVHQP